ncbi:MAG: hypothetical protein ACQESR_30730 [Planctomycetota bacterium]
MVVRQRHLGRLYISGGWIFPGGTLPDASHPPVGRTHGAQTHPRPVRYSLREREAATSFDHD